MFSRSSHSARGWAEPVLSGGGARTRGTEGARPLLGQERALVENAFVGPGAALPADARAPLELGFGVDFSRVRIYSDARANDAAAALGARAFALGERIAFGRGSYEPQSLGGRELLAHELAHTVQQRGRDAPPALAVSSADSLPEQQARAAASAVMQSRRAPALEPSVPMIAREDGVPDSETKPVDVMAGAAVSQILVSLARKRVGFQTSKGLIFGSIETDLKPGSYVLEPDRVLQRWNVVKPEVKTGLRFDVTLEGALPWTLWYPQTLPLTVAAGQLTEPRTWGDAVDERGQPLDPLWLYEGLPKPLATEPPKSIDDFDAVYYDIDYRSVKGNLSKFLVARYSDESRRDIPLDAIEPATPRLFAAKREALKVMDDYNTLFILGTFPTVFFIITIQPLATPVGSRSPGYSASRRTVPKPPGTNQFEEPAVGAGRGEREPASTSSRAAAQQPAAQNAAPRPERVEPPAPQRSPAAAEKPPAPPATEPQAKGPEPAPRAEPAAAQRSRSSVEPEGTIPEKDFLLGQNPSGPEAFKKTAELPGNQADRATYFERLARELKQRTGWNAGRLGEAADGSIAYHGEAQKKVLVIAPDGRVLTGNWGEHVRFQVGNGKLELIVDWALPGWKQW